MNAKKGILYDDADASGSKAMVQIAPLRKALKMTAADFFVVESISMLRPRFSGL